MTEHPPMPFAWVESNHSAERIAVVLSDEIPAVTATVLQYLSASMHNRVTECLPQEDAAAIKRLVVASSIHSEDVNEMNRGWILNALEFGIERSLNGYEGPSGYRAGARTAGSWPEVSLVGAGDDRAGSAAKLPINLGLSRMKAALVEKVYHAARFKMPPLGVGTVTGIDLYPPDAILVGFERDGLFRGGYAFETGAIRSWLARALGFANSVTPTAPPSSRCEGEFALRLAATAYPRDFHLRDAYALGEFPLDLGIARGLVSEWIENSTEGVPVGMIDFISPGRS